MTWHYQLMKHTEPDGEIWYGVHEFYGTNSYTANPVPITGDDVNDVKWMLENVLEEIEMYGVKDYE